MVDRSPSGAKESCLMGMLDRELLSTLHGADSKIAFLSKLGGRAAELADILSTLWF